MPAWVCSELGEYERFAERQAMLFPGSTDPGTLPLLITSEALIELLNPDLDGMG